METIEMRYFLMAAKYENIHKASKILNISPSAISKSISRLESKLEVKLFTKAGRNICLTENGKKLMHDGAKLMALEKQIVDGYKLDLDGADIHLNITGPELPLSYWSPRVIRKIRDSFSQSNFDIEVATNDEANEMINNYSADFAIICSDVIKTGEMVKKLADIKFKTFASDEHPLVKKNEAIPISKILDQTFVDTDPLILGLGAEGSSTISWRDDKFKRTKVIHTKSLKCLDALLLSGLAIAYLPEYYGEALGLKTLNILDCPYYCKRIIYLTRNKFSLDTIWKLF